MTILIGDCRDRLKELDGKSVQMCVTSPPYWGLRDYGCDGQLGLESTPDEYVSNMVEVFGQVKRVLKDDGTLWLNLGDSYANQKIGNVYAGFNDRYFGRDTDGGKQSKTFDGFNRTFNFGTLKPKNLIGIPWRVAFALQSDGWYLRQDIIWHKPNPMPESVKDRCTKAHEYIFLLSKSSKYFYDADAIKEPAKDWGTRKRKEGSAFVDGTPGRSKQSGGEDCNFSEKGRNKRSVWTVSARAYPGSHFAVFPSDLISPCILAGSRPSDVVLDPFFGSGTTGEVCQNLGRKWVGIELNPDYSKLQQERTAQAGIAI